MAIGTIALLSFTITAGGAGAYRGGTVPTTTESVEIPPTAFPDAVRAGDADAIADTFADDIEFFSPVLAEPFVGKDVVSRLFAVLVDTLEDPQIIEEIHTPGTLVLYFRSAVDGEPIEIVDLIKFDETGRIATFTATSRLTAGTEALGAAVAPHLAEILGV